MAPVPVYDRPRFSPARKKLIFSLVVSLFSTVLSLFLWYLFFRH